MQRIDKFYWDLLECVYLRFFSIVNKWRINPYVCATNFSPATIASFTPHAFVLYRISKKDFYSNWDLGVIRVAESSQLSVHLELWWRLFWPLFDGKERELPLKTRCFSFTWTLIFAKIWRFLWLATWECTTNFKSQVLKFNYVILVKMCFFDITVTLCVNVSKCW